MPHQLRGFILRAALALSVSAILAGCSPSGQTTSDQPGTNEEMIRAAEASFRPSDHDPLPVQPEAEQPSIVDTARALLQGEAAAPTTSEMVQGFRVQAYSTVHIDRARVRMADLEALFPGEWFYLDFASPSYRIRAGNFHTRLDAERFARQMIDQGFTEAWVVPERIYKNVGKRPAPPPAPQTEEQEVK